MDNNLAIQDASQGMPTAQVPVNARVTAAAKQGWGYDSDCRCRKGRCGKMQISH